MDFSHSETEVSELLHPSQDEAFQAPSPPPQRRWIVAIVGASTLAGLLAVLRVGPEPLSSGNEFIGFAGMYNTSFGLVPRTLTISGVDCPNGTNKWMNGDWNLAGKLPDGRPYYVHKYTTSCSSTEDGILYYDKDCDGNGNWGRWMISDWFEPQKRDADIDGDGKCMVEAYLLKQRVYHDYKRWTADLPYATGDKIVGVPPRHHEWNVYCGPTDEWTSMPVTINGGYRSLNANGSWKFLYNATPGENITLETGLTTISEESKKQISSFGSMGGDAGVHMFGTKVYSEVSAQISHSYEKAWKDATKTSNRTFCLPAKDGYKAVFQWKFDVEDDSGAQGTAKTSQFAFTPSHAMPPKCVPGGCVAEDCPHYQQCIDGHYL